MKDKTLYKFQVNQIMKAYPICEKEAKEIVDDYIKIYELDMTLIEFGKMIIDMGRMGFSASEAGKKLKDVLLGFKQFETESFDIGYDKEDLLLHTFDEVKTEVITVMSVIGIKANIIYYLDNLKWALIRFFNRVKEKILFSIKHAK